MRGSAVASWLAAIYLTCCATPTLAVEDGNDAGDGLVLRNGSEVHELRSRAARLGAASGSTDTTWIGYTPGHAGPGNWWSIYAGSGKDGYFRPSNGVAHKGVWDFDSPVQGDSLQGWWPVRNAYASTGGQTRADRNRPWWMFDIGNSANYRINQANGRTFGVLGVWHRDGGSLQPAPAGRPSPGWTPAQGGYAAWMGLRAHGDHTAIDPVTSSPFNETVLATTGLSAISAGGNDQGFPGYGSQMDQMLYRDIDLSTAPPNTSLTIRFRFRTVLSKDAMTTASTKTGWFDSDPLGVTAGSNNPQLSNVISASDAGDALSPRDSFMVYVGQGIEGTWTPAAANFGQNYPARNVYDPQRRWFGEVLRWDRNPASPPSNPQPLSYRGLLSVTGTWPAHADIANPGWVDTSFVIPAATLPALTQNGRVRLVFRVKTNRGFDDQGSAFSSNTRGAAVVDAVSYRIGSDPEVLFGDFENATDIDNATAVSATAAWKSTGKPPAIQFHTHLFSDLIYEDLCGQKGDISRRCNMSGVVISMGDHDYQEAAGGLVDGTAERDRSDGILSPAICLADDDGNPNTPNIHGLYGAGGNGGVGDVAASKDYYIAYDIYTAIMDPFTKTNVWTIGCMSYPGNAKSTHDSYPAWGQMRFSPVMFNPDPQCLTFFDALGASGLIRTSNPNGIPDSIRILVSKMSMCFRLGLGCCCSPTDGGYVDNITLGIVDGPAVPLSAQIWDWINDAFPANETPGLPGTASFDTTAAHVMTGRNNAQTTNSNLRFDVPGDSVVVAGSAATQRVDMVFRILPGPGNYEPVGRPDIGTIVRRPDGRAVVTKGDGSFWDQFRQIPGDFATPNAIALHHNALGGWDPNVWNSARCDTAEPNLFPRIPQGPCAVCVSPPSWMSCYHESDPHFTTLGIVKNRCFITGPTDSATSIVCNGVVPSYLSSRPEHADVTGTTKEFTKIIPDGLLTPGSHVQYFFRAQGAEAPGLATGLLPDTNVVIQPTEGSTDGHRWQQFGVLPNRWKNPAYRHPVTNDYGTGPACLLVVDHNDRRGNERVWVGIADTIGLTPSRYWGAHNGWHAVGSGNLDAAADNRVAKAGPPVPGFVAEHIGQPGSGGPWDMYQVKGAESPTHAAGSIGSRRANRTGTPGQQIVAGKSSRQGPTPEMLDVYYPMMVFLSGDLNTGVLGPYSNHSQNDAGVIMNWLDAASSSTPNRGFWAIGDGFAESNIFGAKQITTDLMLNYLGADLYHNNYIQYSGNTDDLAAYRLFPGWQNKGPQQFQLFGMRNLCLWTNDVLFAGGVGLPTLATVTGEYDRRSMPNGPYRAPAGVFKDWDPSSPYLTQVEGWDIEHLTHPADVRTLDRSGYFHKVLVNVWAQLCSMGGLGPASADEEAAMVRFLNLGNNPLAHGDAIVSFGTPVADRIRVSIYDVGGRRVRRLADRLFAAGAHELRWDGADDRGRALPRGVYFTRLEYTSAGIATARKVTVLK